MKLYYTPGTCSLSPHIVARELGIDLTLVKVDLGTKKDGRDFSAINPKGYVRVLELDDGTRLTEGLAIVQYLADQKAEAGLAPATGTFERYRLAEMLAFIATELHKPYAPLFRPGAGKEEKAASVAHLKKRYATIERQLASGTWLSGTFSIANAYLFVVTSWAAMVNVELTEFPNLRAFQARALARPAVRAALQAEGSPPPRDPQNAGGASFRGPRRRFHEVAAQCFLGAPCLLSCFLW